MYSKTPFIAPDLSDFNAQGEPERTVVIWTDLSFFLNLASDMIHKSISNGIIPSFVKAIMVL